MSSVAPLEVAEVALVEGEATDGGPSMLIEVIAEEVDATDGGLFSSISIRLLVVLLKRKKIFTTTAKDKCLRLSVCSQLI